jgi:tRNA pseudouridine38-40 synthase
VPDPREGPQGLEVGKRESPGGGSPHLDRGIEAGLRRWRLLVAYNGSGFRGFAPQEGQVTVAGALAGALARAARLPAPPGIVCAGRTDAGVHARGQVFHFDSGWRHGPDRLAAALRTGLPATIQIVSVRPVSAEFHARFSALGKTYAYELHLGDADPFTRPYCWPVFRPLDFGAMESAAARLRGRHDFKAFAASRGEGEEDTVRDLRRLDIVRRGRRARIVAEADGFLYKMVRSLVGALVAVGEGRLTPEQVGHILRDRARLPRVETAPPQGLFLLRVAYPRIR